MGELQFGLIAIGTLVVAGLWFRLFRPLAQRDRLTG